MNAKYTAVLCAHASLLTQPLGFMPNCPYPYPPSKLGAGCPQSLVGLMASCYPAFVCRRIRNFGQYDTRAAHYDVTNNIQMMKGMSVFYFKLTPSAVQFVNFFSQLTIILKLGKT